MEVIKMEWLKELLEKAKITDGKLNVDEVMEAVKKEFPKHAVPKNVFNDKCEELKTANETITTLKKENGDNEELQNKIKDYETEIGNKIYYSEKGEKGNLDIFSKNKLQSQEYWIRIILSIRQVELISLHLTRTTILLVLMNQSRLTEKIRLWHICLNRKQDMNLIRVEILQRILLPRKHST